MESEFIAGTALRWKHLEADLQKSLSTACYLGNEFEADVLKGAGGFASKIIFTKVRWIGEGHEQLPHKFVIKITTSEELSILPSFSGEQGQRDARQIATWIGNNEYLLFQNAFGDLNFPSNFPLPKFFGGHFKEENDDVPSYIVMEWVANIEARYQYDDLSKDESCAVLRLLAQIGARTLDNEKVAEVFKFDVRAACDGRFNNTKDTCDRLDKYAELNPELRQTIEKLKTFSQKFDDFELVKKVRNDTSKGHKWLTHGDMTAQNIMWRRIEDKLRVVAIHDWQGTNFSNGIFDLTRFLGQSLSSDELNNNIEFYLSYYYEQFKSELKAEMPLSFEELVEGFEQLFPFTAINIISLLAVYGALILRTAKEDEKEQKKEDLDSKLAGMVQFTAKCIDKWQ